MNHQGKAIIFSAPSGAGKTTIVKRLLSVIPELRFSISATTRSPRHQQENHGKDYYFISVDDFRAKIKGGEFYEWEEVYENLYYGTLKSEVLRIWEEGKHVIFDIDVVGGINLKKIFGDLALSIFVEVKDIEVLRNRLKDRSTEKEHEIEMRINKAIEEMKSATAFDYVLLNENLEHAVVEAKDLILKFINQ